MADNDAIEAMRYKPEIAELIKVVWPIEKKTLRLAYYPFSVQEVTKYLLGLDQNHKFTPQEKTKIFPAVTYALDLLQSEGKVIYIGQSSTKERIYVVPGFNFGEEYTECLIKLGVIAKPEEKSDVETTAVDKSEKNKVTAPEKALNSASCS